MNIVTFTVARNAYSYIGAIRSGTGTSLNQFNNRIRMQCCVVYRFLRLTIAAVLRLKMIFKIFLFHNEENINTPS